MLECESHVYQADMGSSTLDLYLSTISTALPSTCKVFKYFLLKVTCTCTCTESLSQVLNVLKVLILSTLSVLKYYLMYLRKYLST